MSKRKDPIPEVTADEPLFELPRTTDESIIDNLRGTFDARRKVEMDQREAKAQLHESKPDKPPLQPKQPEYTDVFGRRYFCRQVTNRDRAARERCGVPINPRDTWLIECELREGDVAGYPNTISTVGKNEAEVWKVIHSRDQHWRDMQAKWAEWTRTGRQIPNDMTDDELCATFEARTSRYERSNITQEIYMGSAYCEQWSAHYNALGQMGAHLAAGGGGWFDGGAIEHPINGSPFIPRDAEAWFHREAKAHGMEFGPITYNPASGDFSAPLLKQIAEKPPEVAAKPNRLRYPKPVPKGQMSFLD